MRHCGNNIRRFDREFDDDSVAERSVRPVERTFDVHGREAVVSDGAAEESTHNLRVQYA